jgi:hypothetical protein
MQNGRATGERTRRRIGNNELEFYENVIGAAILGIRNLRNLVHTTDDPDVIELATKILYNLQSIRTLTIHRMNARKEAVIGNNENDDDFGGNGQPPAA